MNSVENQNSVKLPENNNENILNAVENVLILPKFLLCNYLTCMIDILSTSRHLGFMQLFLCCIIIMLYERSPHACGTFAFTLQLVN